MSTIDDDNDICLACNKKQNSWVIFYPCHCTVCMTCSKTSRRCCLCGSKIKLQRRLRPNDFELFIEKDLITEASV